MLARHDLPTHLIQHYLCGMSACNNKGLRSICSSQLGFLSTPMYEDWALHTSPDILVQLNSFSAKLESKYEALKTSKAWSGKLDQIAHSMPPRHLALRTPPHPPSWQWWFDSKTCDIYGQAHPTKYHEDPGIRNRPFVPKPSSTQCQATKSSGSCRPNSTSGPCFKKGGKGNSIQCVLQALLENAEDVDDTLLSNLAGSASTHGDDDDASPHSSLLFQ